MPSKAENPRRIPSRGIKRHLEKIIKSPIFANSDRMRRFLDFTVEQALNGKETSLKEYSIALAVFDKPQSFDPRLDPIVRVEAGRLRSKLREYYEGPGRFDPIRITYRRRSYIPQFNYLSLEQGPQDPVRAAPHSRPEAIELRESRIGRAKRKMPAIAILPFINLSASRKHEYFSDAITAEIIDVLSQTTKWNIVSRTSVLRFKNTQEDIREIAGRLGVDAVLEGSVRLADKRVRVAAQLVNAANGYQIWSQIYDRQMDNVFDAQRDLAQKIAQALTGIIHENP